MRKTEDLPRICVGVDLHKMQFTVHAVSEETGEMVLNGVYLTNNQGYKEFCEKLHTIEAENECCIELAVEATGNARYFKNKMEAEIKTMKLEKDLLSNGFTPEESAKLIKDNFAVTTIAEIMKAKVEEAVKSAKAELIKDTTPSSPMGNGTAKGDGKSDFQKFQESKKQTNNKIEL